MRLWENYLKKNLSLLISCLHRTQRWRILYMIMQHCLSLQLITRYRSYFSLFWLSHEPFAVSRIKDLSIYLIYLSPSFSPLIDDSVDSGVTAKATHSDRSRKENLKKRPASTKRRGALNILPRKTATYPRIGKGFLPRDIRQIVPHYPYTRLLWSTEARKRQGCRTFSRGTIRERNEGDL